MYQHTNDNQRSTSVGDLILVIVLIAIIVFIKKISDWITTLPLSGLWTALLVILLIGGIFFIYKKRLCSYRYTIYYKAPPEGELDEFGNQAESPYPLGTILFERMTGGKGKLYEGVNAKDIVALVKPGESYPEKIGFFNLSKLSVYAQKTAHLLVFRRKGKLYGIYFHPNEEFVAHVYESPIAEQIQPAN